MWNVLLVECKMYTVGLYASVTTNGVILAEIDAILKAFNREAGAPSQRRVIVEFSHIYCRIIMTETVARSPSMIYSRKKLSTQGKHWE